MGANELREHELGGMENLTYGEYNKQFNIALDKTLKFCPLGTFNEAEQENFSGKIDSRPCCYAWATFIRVTSMASIYTRKDVKNRIRQFWKDAEEQLGLLKSRKRWKRCK